MISLMRAPLILTFSIGALLALSAPASARARDEAMLNAYRCAGIASTRIWLDCYYGAAQPVRAALGLLPAPAEQLRLGLSPPAGGERQNQDLRDEVMASAGHCGSLADERQWLSCYYAAAVPVRASLGLSVPTASPAQDAQIKSNHPSPRVPSRHLSAFAELLGAPDTSIASRMASYSFDRYGNFTVTLANGQVWRQVEGDTSTARWHKSASSYLVNITGGAFGSYNFTVNGGPSKFKVRRVSER
jgi:hypothetical protein